jgi:hypothetical protein
MVVRGRPESTARDVRCVHAERRAAGVTGHLRNLTDPASGERPGSTPASVRFVDGDGSINTAGDGAKDVAFLQGFIVRRNRGPGRRRRLRRGLTYEHVNPGGQNYKINEFRYNNAAAEFVEVHGPAGAFPAGTELELLRVRSNGTVLSSVSLAGRRCRSTALFVVGDTGVAERGPRACRLGCGGQHPQHERRLDPAIQHRHRECVYDSVVFLRVWQDQGPHARPVETHGVTGESFGMARRDRQRYRELYDGALSGRGRHGDQREGFLVHACVTGRAQWRLRPDPLDVQLQQRSGGRLQRLSIVHRRSVRRWCFAERRKRASLRGYNGRRSTDVHDLGDAALGGSGAGYTVTGEVFIPNSAAPMQSIGVGICGRQGSNFFTARPTPPAPSGYESGYWLIFENAAGAGAQRRTRRSCGYL